MRDPLRFLALCSISTATGAVISLLPNPSIKFQMPSHTAPLAAVSTVDGRQAQAYSGSVSVAPNGYEMEYSQAWDLVDRYFLYRDRLANWQAWRHRYDGRLKSAIDADNAIEEMVHSLGDEYTFFRDGDETAERDRQEKRHNVVSARRLPRSVGYIHIRTFNSENCIDETRAALKMLGPERAYILDLRGNNGGSITNATRIFSLFVQQGCFVRMEGVSDGKRDLEELSVNPNGIVTIENGASCRASREPNLAGLKPLAVLVNESTKSAAEMLAGALRDNKRATVFGVKTFGKGIIQRIWQFDDQGTSIKITAARYFLPSGTSIHGVGLRPDVLISSKQKSDSQLSAALRWLSKPSRS
jgi:C-terminal processing protease CtpA/Prc